MADKRASNTASAKRGLVLVGGGAKGAYAFGILKGLREYGISFDAIAGTSVGGLNAFLWATDQLSDGEAIWNYLSEDRVFPCRIPQSIGRVVRMPLLVCGILWSYCSLSLQKEHTELLDRYVNKIRRLILPSAMLTLALACALIGTGHPTCIRFGGAMLVTVTWCSMPYYITPRGFRRYSVARVGLPMSAYVTQAALMAEMHARGFLGESIAWAVIMVTPQPAAMGV